MSLIDNLKHKIVHSIVLGTLVVLILAVYADLDAIVSAFVQFEWRYVFLIIALTILNYLLRFYKWDYYLLYLILMSIKKTAP